MKSNTLKSFLITFLFILTGKMYSQLNTDVDTTKIAFIAYWSKGDNYKFKMKKSIERIKDDKIVKNDSIVYDAFFKVLDSTATSYTISWKYKCDILYALNLPEKLKTNKNAIREIEVIYTTDETGSEVKIENWKVLSDIFTKAINDAKSNLNSEEDKIYTSILTPIVTALSQQEGIEEFCAKELKLFHYPFGVEFDPKEELNYDEVIPSPFSKQGLKAKTRVYFEEHSYKDSSCTFYTELIIDPDDSKKMLLSVLKNVDNQDKDIKQYVKKSKYEINDFNGFSYVYNPGVPMYIINTRKVEIDVKDIKESRTDIIEIEFIEEIKQ